MAQTSTRRQGREQAFTVLFEKSFKDETTEEIIENAQLARDFELEPFAKELLAGVENNLEKIDTEINVNLQGWKLNRISKTSLGLLRIAIYEMLFAPASKLTHDQKAMAINEAVRLSKKYGGNEESAFVNGILGGIARKLEQPEL